MSAATAAMALASRGLCVFPVDPASKAPKTRHGCKDATTSKPKILELWQHHPAAGIGVATGRPSGVVVVDVDPSSGGADGFAELAGQLGAPGRTVQVSTPRGGWHLWFRAPARAVPCSVGSLAPGVDVRGDGGYVVAPPTTRPDGTGWRWACPGAPLAELQPEWLEALTAAPSGEKPAAPASTWVSMLTDGIAAGRRNQSLAALIGHLLARNVDARLAGELLHVVNRHSCRPPLDGAEVDRIVESIAGCELRKRKGTR